jgi:hypothetical protein
LAGWRGGVELIATYKVGREASPIGSTSVVPIVTTVGDGASVAYIAYLASWAAAIALQAHISVEDTHTLSTVPGEVDITLIITRWSSAT